jgi:hypothetical protein
MADSKHDLNYTATYMGQYRVQPVRELLNAATMSGFQSRASELVPMG